MPVDGLRPASLLQRVSGAAKDAGAREERKRRQEQPPEEGEEQSAVFAKEERPAEDNPATDGETHKKIDIRV